MSEKPFEAAPRDGRSILIQEENANGTRYSASVHFYRYSEEDRERDGIEEEGCWCYTDDLLSDAAPMGPETPFTWREDPYAELADTQ